MPKRTDFPFPLTKLAKGLGISAPTLRTYRKRSDFPKLNRGQDADAYRETVAEWMREHGLPHRGRPPRLGNGKGAKSSNDHDTAMDQLKRRELELKVEAAELRTAAARQRICESVRATVSDMYAEILGDVGRQVSALGLPAPKARKLEAIMREAITRVTNATPTD